MRRILEDELLDALPSGDPLALGSRRDLRRINRLMTNSRICREAILASLGGRKPARIVELGCGDGSFLAKIARHSPAGWHGMEIWLVDRVPAVEKGSLQIFQEAGWRARTVTADVFDWLAEAPEADVYLANLFLHHFEETRLAALFTGIAARSSSLVACEPRRSAFALQASRLVGLLGCNRVTRHDAVVSVRAGFCGRELSGLWPKGGAWTLSETRAGLFSHLFTASGALEKPPRRP